MRENCHKKMSSRDELIGGWWSQSIENFDLILSSISSICGKVVSSAECQNMKPAVSS